MAKSLKGYVIRWIRGKMVPIRKGLERATKSQNKLVDSYLKAKKTKSGRLVPVKQSSIKQMAKRLKKTGSPIKIPKIKYLGSGVDFNVFKRSSSNDFVLKSLKQWGGKPTRGTASKAFNRRWPELKDKLAVHKTLGDNLPNYGIPTIPSEIIRLKKGKRAIIQEYIPPKEMGSRYNPSGQQDRMFREGKKIRADHGLNIDSHTGNVTKHGYMTDTGGSLFGSKVSDLDRTGEEILGIDNWYGTNIKDVANKATIMSDEAILSGVSRKTLRKMNKLVSQGYKYKKVGKNEYKLVFHKKRK